MQKLTVIAIFKGDHPSMEYIPGDRYVLSCTIKNDMFYVQAYNRPVVAYSSLFTFLKNWEVIHE